MLDTLVQGTARGVDPASVKSAIPNPMALGARGTAVRLMVLSQTSRIAVTASVIGVAFAIGLARLTQSMLYGVTPLDPRVQGGAALLMLAVAFVAAMVPAKRAAAVDPVDALRAE